MPSYIDNEKAKEELIHVGILGMKWGHRKGGSSSSGSHGKSSWKNQDITPDEQIKAYSRAAKRMNSGGIDRFNNKPAYKGKNLMAKGNEKLLERYNADYQRTFNKMWAQEIKSTAMLKAGARRTSLRKTRIRDINNSTVFATAAVAATTGVLAVIGMWRLANK